ncbi:MAG TPA: ATP-dependent RNA helicase HrpA [Mycobacteriales bacterium]
MRDDERLAQRTAAAAALGPLAFPPDLPVSGARDEIAAAVRDHQVVVLAGETGSGKTTQLPKILLGLGRGVQGMIGHTQPRRIAARAVAERVAAEIGTDVGGLVGYCVRFHDQVGDRTLVKVMTDGILLAELRRDRDLRAYDTIVIDEAHERSLTIDFLLGYLRQLLPRRPDLKVVITSATLDPERFSRHFGGAPVLTVSGRTYPVEVRYRPLDDEHDQVDGIVAACAELRREGPGDVLVFLSGEREIRDASEALRGGDDEVVPLFGRLSAAEQHRVFAPHRGRRIVLATNVAETSLTVPGIRYVVDCGTARISRYSRRTKVQRLPVEPVSRASAAQRAGRCGRVADGVCIRLYDEDDFASRPEFTDPEIVRTNLASVLLQMAALGLGEVGDFPFVDAPDPRAVRDGRQLLEELGALDGGRLTRVGRHLARLPLDPRLARMVVEAGSRGCLAEILVIVAALSIQDPRERPLDQQQQADALHARFAEPASDLLAWLNLWRYLAEQQEALSGNAFRRLCKREHLHYLRVREWQDLHGQLRRAVRGLRLDPDASGDAATVTRCLLAGLLSHVGLRVDRRDYQGARGTRFTIAPGTPLARKPPPLVVAAELVETTRLYARQVARVEPAWVEEVGAHLLARSYSEPHWSLSRGSVVAYERVTLYGVPIVARRAVQYARIDPALCHELFVREALAAGEWRTHHAFWAHNATVLADLDALATRTRRPELVPDEEARYEFYAARVPDHVVGTVTFDRWWKAERREHPDLLDMSAAGLVREPVDDTGHPTVWVSGDLNFDLHYAFEPGAADDGVTVDVPLAQLGRISEADLGWQVPGLREELVAALIKTLPKALRVPLVPAPDTARALVPGLRRADGDLLTALSQQVRRQRGVVVPVDAWDLERVPDRLRPTYRVLGENGEEVGSGKDLARLRTQLEPLVRQAVSRAAADLEVAGLTAWTVGEIPERVQHGEVVGWPALVDEGSSVALRVLPSPAPDVHHAGVRRLILLSIPSPFVAVADRLDTRAKLTLGSGPYDSPAALLADCADAAADSLMTADPRDAAAFDAQRERVRADLAAAMSAILDDVQQIFDVGRRLDALDLGGPMGQDIRAHHRALVHPGFVTEVGAARLPDIVRYLRADEVRAARRSPRDAVRSDDVRAVTAEWSAMPPGPARDEIRWLIEELRVSLFAQTVGAKGPVSVPRILRRIDESVDA